MLSMKCIQDKIEKRVKEELDKRFKVNRCRAVGHEGRKANRQAGTHTGRGVGR